MTRPADRRLRLAAAHLYLVTEAGTDPDLLRGALEGGVDMLQLRDPAASDEVLLRCAAAFRRLCDQYGALFWLNDRPDLALRAGADGVHLGQDDMAPADAREVVGDELLIGLSTHSPEQLEAAIAVGADQLSVGPVWETPTKPGRPAAGLDYVRHAARVQPPRPWFAIGGIDERNAASVIGAGAHGVAVSSAILRAPAPALVVERLAEIIAREGAWR